MTANVENCVRIKSLYRGANLYATISPTLIHLSIENFDDFRTLAGVNLIERLINELISRGVTLEDVASFCFESSYRPGDLPEILSKILVKG